MDAPMQLNFDVLVAVMSYLYGSDLLSAMQTCHTLYSGGIPFLLRFPVVLRTRAKVLSFCRFVLVDPARFQLLRALDISAPGRFKPGPKADLLLAMFMHAKYLEHLKISDCEILVSDQRIASAIAALASIKSLTLHTLNEAAYLVLALSQSDLVAIEIGFWRDDVMGPEDPVPLLKGFSHCLRELRVTYAEFLQHDILYPCVEILVIDDCRFALAQPLIGCFPNVNDLSLWTGQEDEALEDEEIEEHRQMNMHSQQEVGQWDSLNHLRGDIRSLYLLGLTCSVKHLDVQSTFLTSTRVRQLSTLLLQGRPYALSIRIKASGFDMGLLTQLLIPVRGSLARIIVYLDLSEFSQYPGDVLVSFPPLDRP